MNEVDSAPRTRRPLRRGWFILGCLLTSWLCWGGVNQWLEPKPLWSKSYPGQKYLYPHFEETASHYLLATERQYGLSNNRERTQALVILDRQSGRELYRTELDVRSTLEYDHPPYQPRIVDDTVWRFTAQREDVTGVMIHRLCCWKFKEEREERVVRTWRISRDYHFWVSWPVSSKRFFLRYYSPHELYHFRVTADVMKALIVQHLLSQALLPGLVWYESWNLPERPDQSPPFLARWVLQIERSQGQLEFSQDGTQAALMESWGDARLAALRAQKYGRSSFQGKELFNLFRSSSQGILFYDTSSGKITRHYEDEAAHHSSGSVGWHGSYMTTTSFQVNPETILTLEQLQAGAANINHNLYSHTFRRQDTVYRQDRERLHPLRWPEGVPRDISHSLLGTSVWGWNNSLVQRKWYELAIQGDELVLLRRIDPTHGGELNSVYFFESGGQYLLYQPSPAYALLQKCSGKSAWLDGLLKKLRPYLRITNDLAVFEDHGWYKNEHRFQQQHVTNYPFRFSNLYLLDIVKDDKHVSRITLNAYAVPLSLYSAWWGRVAGFIPLVVMVVMLLRRKSRSDQPATLPTR